MTTTHNLTTEEESICQWAIWNVDKDNQAYRYKTTYNHRHLWNNITHFAPIINAVLATLALMAPEEVSALAKKADAELDLIKERAYDPVTKQYEPDWLDELIDTEAKNPDLYSDLRRDAVNPKQLRC